MFLEYVGLGGEKRGVGGQKEGKKTEPEKIRAQFHDSAYRRIMRLWTRFPAYVQAPNFCASLVSVEYQVMWSTHAQQPKFAANPWNTLAVSTEFPASVSAEIGPSLCLYCLGLKPLVALWFVHSSGVFFLFFFFTLVCLFYSFTGPHVRLFWTPKSCPLKVTQFTLSNKNWCGLVNTTSHLEVQTLLSWWDLSARPYRRPSVWKCFQNRHCRVLYLSGVLTMCGASNDVFNGKD